MKKGYPFEVWYKGKNIKINNCDELVEIVSRAFEELLEFSKNAKLIHAIDKFADSFDNIQLEDRRTEDMFMSYEFYKNNPQQAYNIVSFVWFTAYCLINQFQPKMF